MTTTVRPTGATSFALPTELYVTREQAIGNSEVRAQVLQGLRDRRRHLISDLETVRADLRTLEAAEAR